MKRILYGVSPIGLGHATRAIAVADEIDQTEAKLVFASGGHAAQYLRAMGFETREVITEPVPRVVEGEMKDASLWYAKFWLGLRRSKRKVERLVTELNPHLIVGDEEFASTTVALERGIPHALIADELELGFANGRLARQLEARASRWYHRLQARVELLVIPEEGQDSGNRRFVGPVARKVTMGRADTRKRFGLPAEGPMILFSMSGSGIGDSLLRKTILAVRQWAPEAFLAVSGNRSQGRSADRYFDLGVVAQNQDLVAASDLVVSTAGKSTIDEAAASGTPIIAIPLKNHAEQERNAAQLGYAPEDSERLGELIEDKLGRKEAPREFKGAGRIADIVMSAAQRNGRER